MPRQDGEIIFQYHTVDNNDPSDADATVGIESPDQSDGVLYTFFRQYPAGAATLTAGRAIRFVPRPWGEIVDVATTPSTAHVTALGLVQPNPFNPSTTIGYQMGRTEHVTLRLYDVGGHLIRTLQDGVVEAGRHTVRWDGRDLSGVEVASGVYFVRMESSDVSQVRRLTLIR